MLCEISFPFSVIIRLRGKRTFNTPSKTNGAELRPVGDAHPTVNQDSSLMIDTFPQFPPDAGFEEVEHTADWAYRVWAPDHNNLFLQAIRGLYALVEADVVSSPRVTRTVHLQGVDYESLLVAWLNELLHFRDSENLGFNQIHITRLDSTNLEATLNGAAIRQWKKDIKAATYHNLAITPTAAGWEATIVLDV